MDHDQDSTAECPTLDKVPGDRVRGSNQAGMRAYNERLVLSLVRRDGALAKSDIARLTGLSAQTVSVIMRSLEADGLLARGEPIRGRIGQPSVPMSLAADGAFFFGLKIGRRSVDLMLIDFLGGIVAARGLVHGRVAGRHVRLPTGVELGNRKAAGRERRCPLRCRPSMENPISQ